MSHSYTDNQPLAELLPTLKTYLDARLTMLCINPDLEIVRLTGEHVYCAGLLAAEYERMGGAVVYFGKPHKAVYDACLETLHGIDKKRIPAVGDSLLNDIKGGNAQGIDTVLVTGGILQAHIGTKAEGMLLEVVAKHAQAAEAQPDYVIERFVW